MKKSFILFFALCALISTGCSKKESTGGIDNALAGRWQLLSITDHDAGTIIQKAPEQAGDVELSFIFNNSTGGTLTAKTPVNSLNGHFTISNSRNLNIQGDYTKVNEQPFGSVFLCNLQFVSDYFFDDTRRLVIHTSSRKTMLLEKR